MRAILHLARRSTYADYLSVEQASVHRHEYIDGVIVAMAGGSDEHNALAARVTYCLTGTLPPGCRTYAADQRYWIAASERGRYADVSVICGKPDHPAHDAYASTNPTIVVEVASPSSEGNDHGEKRLDFQTLASLQAYIVASQDARQIELWRRASDGSWPEAPHVCLDGDTVPLPGASIPVADIYDGVLDADGRSLLR